VIAVATAATPIYRRLYPRWPGHGDLDIRVDLADGRTWLRADQVEQLAGIPRWATGDTLLGDEEVLAIGDAWFYDLDGAIAKCAHHGTALAADFADWIREFTANIDDQALETAHKTVPFIHALTVAQAARVLDGDPAISMGQNRLFAHLEQLGWIERSTAAHDWIITCTPHERDWLTLRTVTIPDGRETRRYLQVHVTRAGLDEIRRTLYALGRGDPAEQPTLTPLF
jgi:hypothetical protein